MLFDGALRALPPPALPSLERATGVMARRYSCWSDMAGLRTVSDGGERGEYVIEADQLRHLPQ